MTDQPLAPEEGVPTPDYEPEPILADLPEEAPDLAEAPRTDRAEEDEDA